MTSDIYGIDGVARRNFWWHIGLGMEVVESKWCKWGFSDSNEKFIGGVVRRIVIVAFAIMLLMSVMASAEGYFPIDPSKYVDGPGFLGNVPNEFIVILKDNVTVNHGKDAQSRGYWLSTPRYPARQQKASDILFQCGLSGVPDTNNRGGEVQGGSIHLGILPHAESRPLCRCAFTAGWACRLDAAPTSAPRLASQSTYEWEGAPVAIEILFLPDGRRASNRCCAIRRAQSCTGRPL